MVLELIRGKKVCGGANALNTGKKGCLVELGAIEHFIAIKKGMVIPKETDFTLAYVTEQIQRGNFIPVLGATNFEDLSADDTFNTNTSGIEKLNLKGLPKYQLWYEEGHEFYRQISKLSSYKSYDFMIGDEEGRWAIAYNGNNDFVGYSMGHVTPGKRRVKVKGGENEAKPIAFQFIDRLQYDFRYDIFQPTELGFYPTDIPAVNGVTAMFTQIPSAADTVLYFKLVLTSDKTTEVEGVLVGNIVVNVNGNPVVVSNLNEATPGNYEATVPAIVAADVIDIISNDDTYTTDIINISGDLYRIDSVSETAIA